MGLIPEHVRAQLKARFDLRLSGPVHLTLYTRPGSSRLILPAGVGCATCEDARQMAELLRDAAPEKVTLDVVDTSRDPDRGTMLQRGTDADFIRMLARRNGFEAYVERTSGPVKEGAAGTTAGGDAGEGEGEAATEAETGGADAAAGDRGAGAAARFAASVGSSAARYGTRSSENAPNASGPARGYSRSRSGTTFGERSSGEMAPEARRLKLSISVRIPSATPQAEAISAATVNV